MPTAELIELLEDELDLIVNKAHKSGLNFWQILRVFLEHCCRLQLQAEAEFWKKVK